MYGFIEQSLAQLLQLEFEPYDLNSGSKAAIINEDDFNRLITFLSDMAHADFPGDAIMQPVEANTDVEGLNIIIHPYWRDMDVLHGLTGGEVKETSAYQAIVNIHAAIDRAKAHDLIKEYWIGSRVIEHVVDDPVEIDEDTPEEVEDVEEELSFNDKFIEDLKQAVGNVGYVQKKIGDNWCLSLAGGANTNLDSIYQLSKDLDKNVIIMWAGQKTIMSSVKKAFKVSELLDHTIFLNVSPRSFMGEFVAPSTNSYLDNICFGKKIKSIHCLSNAHLELERSKINSRDITEEEKKILKDEINEKMKLSPYAKYDAIFKDTITNVVWAVRERCFVHMMFNYSAISTNDEVFNICMKELGRRFGGRLTQQELKVIDQEYFDSISSRNRDAYEELSATSSNSVIEELKNERDSNQKLYKEKLDEAMEHGKLAQKFSEQVNAFDESNFIESQKKKANESYDMTISIPEVSSIVINSDRVDVYTNNLYCQDERSKKWHDIGTFHIKIGMISNEYNTSKTVRVHNTKHQIDAFENQMQAPHVFHDGRICHGTLSIGMTEAYVRRDLFELVYMIISFLQNANTDDSAGAHVNDWPEVSEEIAKGVFNKPENKEESEASKKFDNMFADCIPIAI